jgi:FtsP/CotA-like multicopper oxidase with cupredoxin domain
MRRLSRRSWLQTGFGTMAASGLAAGLRRGAHASEHPPAGHTPHALGPVGRVTAGGFDPSRYLRTWNFSDLAPAERARFYRETLRPDGTRLREYEFYAVDRQIEIAPGVFFPAWAYNGQVPGPTIRATEGDRVKVTFVNQGSHPHSIHFHGWHPSEMDGSLPDQQVMPGDRFVYEFDAEPYGLHLYHCHTAPLKRHIHKGLYGVFIIDPRGRGSADPGRRPADELVMVMNGFDTNFDADNEVYAVNTVANHYMHEPITVTVGRLVRVYLVNLTEFDPINSFHLHAVFFDVYRTGTRLTTSEHTDTVMLCQGERAVLETTFRYPGDYMFHAHQTEFAELGWMGLFRAVPERHET